MGDNIRHPDNSPIPLHTDNSATSKDINSGPFQIKSSGFFQGNTMKSRLIKTPSIPGVRTNSNNGNKTQLTTHISSTKSTTANLLHTAKTPTYPMLPFGEKKDYVIESLELQKLNSILRHAQVSNQILIQLFESHPSEAGAMELLSRPLHEHEIIHIGHVGKSVIPHNSKFWDLAIQKIDFQSMKPDELIALLITSHFHPNLLDTLLNTEAIDALLLIEKIQSHPDTQEIRAPFSIALFNYLKKVTLSEQHIPDWHALLIRIAIKLDTPIFWEKITLEISHKAR